MKGAINVGERDKKETIWQSLAAHEPAQSALLQRMLSRRSVLGGMLAASGAAVGLAALGGAAAAQGEAPADAAPAEQQVYRVASDPGNQKDLDFYEMVYGRPYIADLFSDPLVRLNKNQEIIPAAATKWSSSSDGKTWTFELDPNLVWSDGTPVTAKDWVKTFQYSADPKHAWDFVWFWSGNIVNYTEAAAGKVPLDQIGVTQGETEHQLVVKTVDPAPYLAAKMLYSAPLSAAALEKNGPLYNTKPETALSAGPFILEEWVHDQSVTYKRNPSYKGTLQPIPFQKVIVKMAPPNTWFTLYQSGETDFMEGPQPADLKIIESDPDLQKQVYQGFGDFGCFYFFFDTTKPPFNDLKVRQAFSHVLDRDAIKKQILGKQGNPAYSWLEKGFPGADPDALKTIQAFDPDLGKKLLADAGFPGGKGFPKLTLQERGGGFPIEDSTCQAYVSMLKQYLGITAEVQIVDRTTFYSEINKVPFGWISYGMDYFDPGNMLGVWRSGGRHAWSDPEYDKQYDAANVFIGDPAKRIEMFHAVEKILVEQVPAVFAWHYTPIQLIKPYIKGDAITPDKNGNTSIHWPGYSTGSTVPTGLYVTKDAPANRK